MEMWVTGYFNEYLYRKDSVDILLVDADVDDDTEAAGYCRLSHALPYRKMPLKLPQWTFNTEKLSVKTA